MLLPLPPTCVVVVVTDVVLWETAWGDLCSPANPGGSCSPCFWGVDEAAECSSVAIWASFGLLLLFVAEGGFSLRVLIRSTTENVFGDQVAGFSALLLFPVQTLGLA